MKLKKFFECRIPENRCNLKCSYCYLSQSHRMHNIKGKYKYDIEVIKKALTKERLNGICYFSLCAYGETLLDEKTIEIAEVLLENGHFVNITTNGTIDKSIEKLLKFKEEYRSRLQIAFSFHYLELKRINKLSGFFKNIKKVKNKNISFVLQLNLCDDYIPYLNEIKEISLKELKILPQIVLTRDERDKKHMKIESELPLEKYIKIGETFNSPLFDYTVKNFNKPQKYFCYAGDWSGIIYLGTGIFKKCYNDPREQDIFRDINQSIKFEAIGKNNCKPYCINSSHFLSLGVVPEIKNETYYQLRNREGCYSEEMSKFLSQKLYLNNREYSKMKKIVVNLKTKSLILRKIIKKLRNILSLL